MLEEVGFENAELAGETGFNSTPKTKGVLIRAKKPLQYGNKGKPANEHNFEEKKIHTKKMKAPPSISAVVDRAFALGARKAKIIDTATVIVEKWVRWKCLYGCPFYDKDGYHPPFAPGVEETIEVLGSFTKAILLNGPKGKDLSDIAVRLEWEAYRMGFYKAFALTALPSGSGEKSDAGAT